MEPRLEAHIDRLTEKTYIHFVRDDTKNGENSEKVKNCSGGGSELNILTH